jgi:hypothetical protein
MSLFQVLTETSAVLRYLSLQIRYVFNSTNIVSQDSSVGIATGYGLVGWGSILGGGTTLFSFSQRPGQFWGPPSFLACDYRALLPRGKAAGS